MCRGFKQDRTMTKRYYVLPFLLDGHLVARVDLKADRQAGVLRVRGAYAEESVCGAPEEALRLAVELAAELAALGSFLGLRGLEVEPTGDLAAPLAAQA